MVLKLAKSTGLWLFFLLALVLSPASVWSQDYQTEGQQGYGAQEQTAQTKVSGEEIAAFAKAQNKIAKIRQNYQSKLSSISDQAERQKMVQEMNEKLVDAVKSAGLSVEKYNEIFNASQNDSALQQRISEVMQSLQ